MGQILINIDVPDIKEATRFYTQAFGLKVGQEIGDQAVELLGFNSPLYLLKNDEGSAPYEGADCFRSFRRHWTPVHLDVVVESIENAVEVAKSAGAISEGGIQTAVWGRLALFSDPFGNGF